MNRTRDFPFLANNPGLCYLDSAATSPKPRAVIDAMTRFYEECGVNIHRALYEPAVESARRYEEARVGLAKLVGADPRQVVFVRGATEAINFLATTLGARLGKGDEILLSVMEHHSNLVPWQEAARRTGATLLFVGITKQHGFDVHDFERKLSRRTKIVAVSHASNVLGTVVPLAHVIARAHAFGARIIVDGAQGAGHLPLNLAQLKPDAYAISGHKLYGPFGAGALILAPDLIDGPAALPPYQFGGGMISSVGLTESSFVEAPDKYEAGTPDVAAVVGLGAAIAYLEKIGVAKAHAHELAIARLAWKELAAIPQVTLYGPDPSLPSERTAVISFDVKGIHPHDLAQLLAEEKIAIRVGHHCAMPLLKHLGVDALNRASFSLANTTADARKLSQAVRRAIRFFGGAV